MLDPRFKSLAFITDQDIKESIKEEVLNRMEKIKEKAEAEKEASIEIEGIVTREGDPEEDMIEENSSKRKKLMALDCFLGPQSEISVVTVRKESSRDGTVSRNVVER